MSVPARTRVPQHLRPPDGEVLDPGPVPAQGSPRLAGPAPSSPRAPRRRRGGPQGLDPRPGRIPGLDGLRALAITAVLIFHLTPTLLPGGFLGVDVFFVVSGFLITTLLLRDLTRHGRVDLLGFWLRRARRLVPAVVVVVLVAVGAARLVGGDLLVGIGRQMLGALTFSTNWVEVSAGTSYFDATSPQLFATFWSLAVEEQFYLLWPPLLVLLVAAVPTLRHRLWVSGGVALASAAAMGVLFTPGEDATRVYYGTDTHLFGLLLGVGLALAWADPGRAGLRSRLWRRWRGPAVLVALAVLVLLMRTLDEHSAWTFRGGILLACLATVVLIAALLESGSPWRSLMSLRPLGWLGSRSYGIYLWHWPLLLIARELVPFAPGSTTGWWVLSGVLVLTLVVAELSYRGIEQPIRAAGFLACLRRIRAWARTPWQDSRTPRIAVGLVALTVALAAAAVLTAPAKSSTQIAIEDAEADLDDRLGTPGEPGVPGTSPTPAEPPAPSDQDSSPVDGGATEDAPVAAAPERAPEARSEEDPGASASDTPDPAQAAGAPQEWGWSRDDDGLWVPDGDDLTMIGDSLVVTSADGVEYRFPGTTFVARSNRQWGDAVPVLEDALAQDLVRDNVVVHFGTNAGVDEERLRDVLDLLGPDRRVVVVNLYSDSTFVPGSNETIARVVAEHPNAVVGDWHAAAGAQPETLQSDRVHPDIDGMHVYAQMVAESFDALARRG